MKDGIKERFFSSPILSAIAVSLFSVAFLSLPNIFTLQKNLLFAFNIFSRAVVATGAVILAIICGFKPFSKPVLSLSAILLSVLGLMVCVNNFPVIGFATGNVVLTEDPEIFKYICLCISVGVAEEFMFRGFVMPLLSVALKGKKHAPLLTVALSAGIFSFCHQQSSVQYFFRGNTFHAITGRLYLFNGLSVRGDIPAYRKRRFPRNFTRRL